jgi:formamidopyrimidine-DNA glycosylase
MKGLQITKVIVDRDDSLCFDKDEPLEVARALRGAVVTGSGRKGKYFWLILDRKPWVIFHMGMTGNVEIRRMRGKSDPVRGWGGPKLWRDATQKGRAERGKPPRFCRLFLTLANGDEIAVTDPRRFGRIRLSEDPENAPSIRRLGYDPLHEFPPAKVLAAKLARRRVKIKAVLLDQKLFAGVGNWIADEVLYQAGIDPHRIASELSAAEVVKLRRKVMSVIRDSVRMSADYDRYPKSWLFHYRWGKTKNAQDHLGREILHETIGGRTTAWVPQAQF